MVQVPKPPPSRPTPLNEGVNRGRGGKPPVGGSKPPPPPPKKGS